MMLIAVNGQTACSFCIYLRLIVENSLRASYKIQNRKGPSISHLLLLIVYLCFRDMKCIARKFQTGEMRIVMNYDSNRVNMRSGWPLMAYIIVLTNILCFRNTKFTVGTIKCSPLKMRWRQSVTRSRGVQHTINMCWMKFVCHVKLSSAEGVTPKESVPL